ncbi:MAG: FAD-binding protein, partial [Acidimicrobiales bacterium]
MMSLDRLIEIGGDRVREHAGFGRLTTYRVGGSVRALVTLSSDDDVRELGPLLGASGLPLFVLGNGSNVLVADGEHEVLGVILGGAFGEMSWRIDGDVVRVAAGAGLDLPIASRRLAKAAIAGFEWAVGVPGTFGGAVAMNAGGHGSDMKASVEAVEVWRNGVAHTWRRGELRFGYRTSAIEHDDIVTRVHLGLTHGDAGEAQARIRDIVHWRREHQPGGANAGSAFRNPDDD